MKKFRQFLETKLKGKIPAGKLKFLPSGFQRIGDIIILNLNPELDRYSRHIGRIVLDEFRIKTVCAKTGGIKGDTRKPSVKKIAGNGTETIHRENGCMYRLDVTRIMFAKGNVRERGRIAGIVKSGETVVDMFAGIGYFSIPIAKFSSAEKIIAVDKNPEAIKYLKENIKLNKIKNIEPVLGDCRKIRMENAADRIIMGYLPGTEKFLPAAFSFLKNSGTIHYHNICPKDKLWKKPLEELKRDAEKSGYRLEKAGKRIVKQYSPGIYHVVLDGFFSKTKK